jgi:hypothetical protein
MGPEILFNRTPLKKVCKFSNLAAITQIFFKFNPIDLIQENLFPDFDTFKSHFL